VEPARTDGRRAGGGRSREWSAAAAATGRRRVRGRVRRGRCRRADGQRIQIPGRLAARQLASSSPRRRAISAAAASVKVIATVPSATRAAMSASSAAGAPARPRRSSSSAAAASQPGPSARSRGAPPGRASCRCGAGLERHRLTNSRPPGRARPDRRAGGGGGRRAQAPPDSPRAGGAAQLKRSQRPLPAPSSRAGRPAESSPMLRLASRAAGGPSARAAGGRRCPPAGGDRTRSRRTPGRGPRGCRRAAGEEGACSQAVNRVLPDRELGTVPWSDPAAGRGEAEVAPVVFERRSQKDRAVPRRAARHGRRRRPAAGASRPGEGLFELRRRVSGLAYCESSDCRSCSREQVPFAFSSTRSARKATLRAPSAGPSSATPSISSPSSRRLPPPSPGDARREHLRGGELERQRESWWSSPSS